MDSIIFQSINQLALNWFWLDTLAIFLAKYFEYILIFCFVFFLIKNFKKYWPMVIQAFLAAILARLVFVELIRFLLPRERPFLEDNVNLLLTHSPTSSFPSGHASFYFALATVVYFYNKKSGFLFFLVAFLISFARVFVGVHWPSDILAGVVVGIFAGLLTILFFRQFFPTLLK